MQHELDDILAGSAVDAAPALIGWRLAIGGRSAVIAETEAYQGVADRGCHASKGRTPRTEVLFARHGTLYVYLCYGMHWMLNIVCDREDVPSAVLIRGILVDGLNPKRSNGPGKVTSVLGIGRAWHGRHLDGAPLAVLPPFTPPGRLHRGPRVGIAYAGPQWAGKPWRWWADGFPAVPATP